jgi:hypothetical protein
MKNLDRKQHKNKSAVTKALIAIPLLATIFVAGIAGFAAYHTLAQNNSANTQSSSGNSTTSSSSMASSQTTISGSQDNEFPWSGGFLDGQVVTFVYTQNYSCSPNVTSFGFNATEAANASKFTNCEVGGFKGDTTLPNLYILVPAFSGLSIFGVPQLGATSQGFPTFRNQTVLTQCGAGGTATACGDHPTYLYSPAFTVVEKFLGITNGAFGLPEGVLPTPAHSHLINQSDTGGWNNVAVLVFDPNIFPNAVTGQCSQMVQSNQPNPTANCLNNYAALERALTTNNDSAVHIANCVCQHNPIYEALGQPTSQVVVPGDITVSSLVNPNTNLVLYFNSYNYNPYPPFTDFGDLTSTASTPVP